MGYGFNGTTSLTYSKKRERWESGGEHNCTFYAHDDGTFSAWSYLQKIVIYDEKLKKHIYNCTTFSRTTNSHQSAIRNMLESRVGREGYIYVDMSTLNQGFIFEKLSIDAYHIEVVKKYFPKKLKEFLKSLEDKNNKIKKMQSFRRLEKAVESFRYANKKNWIKAVAAINELGIKSYKPTISFDAIYKGNELGLSLDEIGLYFDISDRQIEYTINFGSIEFLDILYKNGKLNLIVEKFNNLDKNNWQYNNQSKVYSEFQAKFKLGDLC